MTSLARPRHSLRCSLVAALLLVAARAPAQTDAACPPAPACESVTCALQRDGRDCSLPRDTTDCFRCVISGFGHCIQQSNDPVCEARKAAANVEAVARTAECERARAAQNAAYEIAFRACLNRQLQGKLKCDLARSACPAPQGPSK